jgi:hypothetical protein
MDRRLFLRALSGGLAAAFSNAGGGAAQGQLVSEIPNRSVFFEAALPIFSHCTAILAFKFQTLLYAESPELTLKDLKDLPKPRELDEQAKSFFVTRLSDPSSYIFGFQKPMQFYADYGIIFVGGSVPNVLLISTSSKSARLILERRLDPANFIVNIDPLFPTLVDRLRTALQ